LSPLTCSAAVMLLTMSLCIPRIGIFSSVRLLVIIALRELDSAGVGGSDGIVLLVTEVAVTLGMAVAVGSFLDALLPGEKK
jgi:GTP-sensing pleiotropic transcriptional regulator CodY